MFESSFKVLQIQYFLKFFYNCFTCYSFTRVSEPEPYLFYNVGIDFQPKF